MSDQNKQLDWLAREVLEVLAKRYPDDPGYVAGKRKDLAGCNRGEVLMWLRNLDDDNATLVAKHLGIAPDALLVTLRQVLPKM